MAEDASLDDFLDVNGESDDPDAGGGSDGPDEDGRDAPDSEPDPDPDPDPDSEKPGEADRDPGRTDEAEAGAVSPAAPTYRWDPGGGTCERCGETVRRRWRDDGAFVCPDCKEW